MTETIANRYEVERLLGEGAAGKVYLVRDSQRDNEQVALKMLEAPGPRHLELLRHEFSILRTLSHPNIARVYDFGTDEGTGCWFYTSELVSGAAVTESCEGLGPAGVCGLFVQVLRALQYIHSRAVVHYDIKPGNILVSGDTAKLIDFGLATAEAPTRGTMRGTVGYAAPEVVRGEPGDARCDLYSLGVVLYESLARRHPFPGESALATLRMQAEIDPDPPGAHRPGIPPKLDAVVMRLLERDPSARFHWANEVIRALGGAVDTGYEEETVETTMSYVSSGALIGREEELAHLKQKLDSLVGGEDAAPVILLGEVGVGKTRLLREVAYESQLRGLLLLECNCAARLDRPLGSFAGVVEISLGALPAAASQKFSDVSGALSGAQETAATEKLLHRAAGVLMEAAAHRPSVLCVDDLDHCAGDELEFFECLLRCLWLGRQEGRAVRLFILASCNADRARGGGLAEVIGRLEKSGLARVAELPPLSANHAARMLASMLGPGGVPERAVEAVVSATGGNPLAIEQTVQELLRSGLLFYESGRWHVQDALVEHHLPVSGEKALAQRLDELKDVERKMVRALACIGRPAEFELLAAASGLPPKSCAATLSRLAARRLLVLDREGCFWFSSGHMAQVAPSFMSDDELRDMHARIYEHLKGARADVIEQALHAHRAGLEKRSVLPLLRKAAKAAVKRGALSAAIKLNEALKEKEEQESEEWFRALDMLAELYKRSVEIAKNTENLELAWRDSLWKYPELAASIASRLTLNSVRSGNLDRASEVADLALKKLKGAAMAGHRARVLAEKAEIYISQGDMKKARTTLLRARDVAEKLESEEPLNNIDYKLSMVEYFLGNYEDSLRYARAELERESAFRLRGHVRNVLGIVYMKIGKTDDALREFDLSLKIHEEQGNLSAQSYVRQNIGIILYGRGEFDKALDAYTKTKYILQMLGDNISYAATLVNIAGLHLDCGRTKEALASSEEAVEAARASGSATHELTALGTRGQVRSVLGLTAPALADLDSAIAFARESGAHEMLPEVVISKAGALAFLCGDIESAERELTGLTTETGALTPSTAADANILLARLRLLSGEISQAAELLDQLHPDSGASHGAAMLKAEIALARGDFAAAKSELDKIDPGRLAFRPRTRLEILCAACETGLGNPPEGMQRARDALRRARQSEDVVLTFEAALAAAKCARSAGERRVADRHISEAESAFEQIAAALPEGYDRKTLRAMPFYAALDELKAGPGKAPAAAQHRQELRVSGDAGSLARLLEVNRRINSQLELPKLLSEIIDAAIEVTGAQRGFLILKEAGRDNIEVSRNLDRDDLQTPESQLSRTIAERVLAGGEALLVTNATQDERFADARSIAELQLRAVVCVPIKARGSVIGCIYLDNPVREGAFGEGELELARHVSEQAAIAIENSRLYREAIVDSLTEMYTHQFFDMRLKEELARAQRFGRRLSLLLIDIDRFKMVNDVHGHQVGSELLQGISRLIQENTRQMIDSLQRLPEDAAATLGRYGGDEFEVLLPETGREGARTVALRLLHKAQEEVFRIGDAVIQVTLSIGVATFPEDAGDGDSLFHRADEALYSAKRAGRNRVYSPSEGELVADDLTLKRETLEAAGIDPRLLTRDGLALLGMITRLSAVGLDVQELLSLSLSMALDITRAERGFIILVDEEGGLKHLAARDVLDEEITSPEYQTSHTMVRQVIRTGRPHLVTDTMLDKLLSRSKSVVDMGLRSVLCVPMSSQGRVAGVVYLDTTSLTETFGEADMILMEEFTHRIAPIIERAVEQERVQAALRLLQEEVESRYAYTNIVGASKPMRELFRVLDSVTDTDLTVNIYGETGTGKELVAKALHYNSRRKDAPFISLNCAAMPESLLESELFGHVKGAFTGATSDRAGLIEAADGGTLFLDEIGSMPLGMQAKLLRVIEEREVRRVGSTASTAVNIRLICATNTPLEKLVEEGVFREDLFYRINVVRVNVPPLRDRKEDIPLLAQHFVSELARELDAGAKEIDADAIGRLYAHDFPGNVRQLRNVLQQAFISSDERITARSVADALGGQEQQPRPDTAITRSLSVEEYMKEFIQTHQQEYSETELAKKLGIGRNSLWRKRKEWNLPRPE